VPLLVTTSLKVNIKDRLRFLYKDNFKDNIKYLFLYNLYKDKVKTNKRITLFFVFKS
jgi:hypothetical protein